MSLKLFLKDKVYLLLSTLTVLILLTWFLYLIDIQPAVIFLVDLGIVTLLCVELVMEYMRRKRFYSDILKTIDTLEEKYLLFDMVEERDFLDAQIMQYVIRQGNFSMNEAVNKYKFSQEEYKNYIELWVHEIKTPVAALKLILENDNNKQALESVNEINYYIEQALYYARSSSVYKDYIIEELDLKQSVTKTIRQLSNNFIKRDINIEIEMKATTIYSDSKWLEFIIKQILINSIKYSHDHGEIIIRSKELENSVLLEIIDNGIGIDEADLPRIFELGFTGSSGRVYNQATGMGLYLVKELSDSLHIKVKVESYEGTKVSLVIPKTNMYFKD